MNTILSLWKLISFLTFDKYAFLPVEFSMVFKVRVYPLICNYLESISIAYRFTFIHKKKRTL